MRVTSLSCFFFSFSFLGCSKSDFFFWASFLTTFLFKQSFFCAVSGGEGVHLQGLFSFFLIFHVCQFFHFPNFPFFVFLVKCVSFFFFFSIHMPLLAFVSRFNKRCFLRGRVS